MNIDEMLCPNCRSPMTLYRRTPRDYGHWICDKIASCPTLDAKPAEPVVEDRCWLEGGDDTTLEELEAAVDNALEQLKGAIQELTEYQHNEATL